MYFSRRRDDGKIVPLNADLRVCISYLCHGISITEGNIHNTLEQSREGKRLAANIDGVRWLGTVIFSSKVMKVFVRRAWTC